MKNMQNLPVVGMVTENGSGLPMIGELVHDSDKDKVYTIAGWTGRPRVSANHPGGDSIGVFLQYWGGGGELEWEQWAGIARKYIVVVDDDAGE